MRFDFMDVPYGCMMLTDEEALIELLSEMCKQAREK